MTANFAQALPRALLLAAALSFSPPLAALTYLVGAGSVPSQCDFNSLQQAIDAAQLNPGVDFIRVANDQVYTAQALAIGQQDLTITGGYASCAAALPEAALPTGSTLLSGAGGAAAPVLSITGGGVRVLSHLQIRNGDNVQGNESGCGGGIRFNGRGELQLRHVGIAQNQANNGGGICFTGTADPSALSILGDTSINNNTATTGHGGGIAISGTARLFALEDRILIAFNQAPNGDGGGVYVRTPARSDIGSPGLGALGVLYANEAQRGGGLAIVAPEGTSEDACARFFTTDAARPVRLQSNRASVAGGALFLRSNIAGFPFEIARVLVRAYDFRFDGNTAPNGPMAFLAGDVTFDSIETGSTLAFNRPAGYAVCDDEPLFALGRVACGNGAGCNRIEDNRAQDLNGQPTSGNIIELRKSSILSASDFVMRANRGTRLISWSDSDKAYAWITGCAFTDNLLTGELMRGFNDGEMRLRDCTIAGNTLGAGPVLRLDDGEAALALHSVLIDQPGRATLGHPNVSASTVTNLWVVATEVASLRPDPTLRQAGGRFIDPARGDYRLRIGSQAVDYAPAQAGATLDLDGRPRDVDLGEASANSRARDAGAYERQVDDPWLLNGDFVEDLRLWTNPSPAHATWNADSNAPGSVGGSLLFNVPADQVGPTERRTALTQCFNVPSAGRYRIVGQARVVGFNAANHDLPILAWRVRHDGESCSGPFDDSGQTFFGRSTTWAPLAAPLEIEIAASAWTWNSTIEVRLDVAQSLASVTATALIAGFDEIEILRLPSEALIFRDGFE